MGKEGKKSGIRALDFFCIGFGAIVGVGWAVSINNWMANCGGSVPAATGYLLALVMMIPIALVYCELVPMLPVAGGGMAFAYKAFGEVVSLLSGWAAFGAFVAIIPWEAIQITDVLGYLIPSLNNSPTLYTVMGYDVKLTTIIIGAVFSILIYLLNRRGLAAAAKVQNVLCVVLIGTAVLGAVAAVIGGSLSNVTTNIYDVTNPDIYGAASNGLKEVSHSNFFGGAFAIIASAPFFLAGFETIPQGVEDAGGDIKSVGKTVVFSVALACIFYAVLLFCFGYGMPWQKFYTLERPAAATLFKVIYPGTAGTVFYWIITAGALAGLFTTWNGFFTASASLLMAMGRARLVPSIFAKKDKAGVPQNGLIVCFVLSLIGPFLGANLIDTVTCFSAAAFVLSWMITAWCLIRLRKTMPDADRPYRIPGGLPMAYFAAIVASVIFVLLFIPKNPVYMGSKSVIVFGTWIIIGFALYTANIKERKAVSPKERAKVLFGNITNHIN